MTSTLAQSAKTASTAANRVNVEAEWGALKEVVCGIPNLRIPTQLPAAVYNYAPADGLAFFEQNLGKTLQEADHEQFVRAAEQMDRVADILRSKGAKVHRLSEVSDDENAYLSDIFPASILQYFLESPHWVARAKC